MKNQKKLITIISAASTATVAAFAFVVVITNLQNVPATIESSGVESLTVETIGSTKSSELTPTPTIKATITPKVEKNTPTPAESAAVATDTQAPAKETKTAPTQAQAKNTQAPVPKETAAPPPPTTTAPPPPPPTTTAPPPPPPTTQAPAYTPNLENIKSILISKYAASGQWNPDGAYIGEGSISLPIQAVTSDEAVASYYYRNKYGGNTALGTGISSVSISTDGTYIYISTTEYALN